MNRFARAGRLRFLNRADALGVALGVPSAVGTVVLPPRGLMRRKLLLTGRRGDMEELAVALRIVGADMTGKTFVDVGANHGTTSLAALSHGFARVLACEPDPETARYLRATLAVNGLDGRATVVEAAVSNETGTARFEPGETAAGRASGQGALQEDGDVEVAVVTLDALAASGAFEPRDVGLLWMDVQGHEGFVLAGATGVQAPTVAAVRNARLQRAGGVELFREQVLARYSSLVDLRGAQSEEPVAAALDRLLQPDARSTDVLFLP